MIGHTQPVKNVILINNSLIASSSGVRFTEGEIIVWDYLSGELKHLFNRKNGGHVEAIFALVYLPNNNLLISGSDDSSIKVWNISNGSLLYTFDSRNDGHSKPVECLVLLGDNLVASGSQDLTVRIWNLTSAGLKFQPIKVSSYVTRLFYVEEKRLLVVGQLSGFILTLNVISGTITNEFKSHNNVNQLVWFNHLSFLAVGTSYDIQIWYLNESNVTLKYQFDENNGGHLKGTTALNALVYTPNMLASSSWDEIESFVKVWNLGNGSLAYTLKNSLIPDALYNLVSLENRFLCSGSANGKILIWNLSEKRIELFINPAHLGAVKVVCPLGNNFFASGSNDKTVKIWKFFISNKTQKPLSYKQIIFF